MAMTTELSTSPSRADDIKSILGLGLPTMLTQALRMGSFSVILSMCGGLDTLDFGGLAIGLSVTNMFSICPTTGIAALLDTICTQEYGRDPTSTRLGIYFRRAAAFVIMWVVVANVLFFTVGPPVLSWAYGDELGGRAMKYLRLSIVPVLPFDIAMVAQKYFAAQHVVDVVLYAQIVSVVCLVVFLYPAVPYGLEAVALAYGLSRCVTLAVVIGLGFRKPALRATWGSWPLSEVLHPQEFPAFMKQSIPCIVSTMADWWAFESLSMIAGLLGSVAVSAWAITLNLWVVLCAVCVGFYVAGATLIGNAFGAGDARRAKVVAERMLCLGFAAQFVIFCLLGFGMPWLLLLYNNSDPAVNALVVSIAPYIAFGNFGDSVAFEFHAILQAAGDLNFLAYVNVLTQWGVSVSLAGLLVLTETCTIPRLSMCLAAGTTLHNVAASIRVLRLDWDQAARDAAQAGAIVKETSPADEAAAPQPATVTVESCKEVSS